MQAPQAVVRAVKAALKSQAKGGKVIKRNVRLAVTGKIREAGGLTKFGIGRAMIEMAVQHIIETELTRQMKMPITDHQRQYMLPAGTPPEILASLPKIAQYICLDDGTDPPWVKSLDASPDEWFANNNLKDKKARQTQVAANIPLDIGRFLAAFNFASLTEAFEKGLKERRGK